VNHPPAFRLDGHAAGDEDPTVAAHLETCEACAAYVKAATQETPTRVNAEAFVAKLRARDAPRPIGRILYIATPILAAAAAVFFLVRSPETRAPTTVAPSTSAPATRFKGTIQLAVVRDRSGAQERLTSEVPVKPGDRIRVEVGVDDERPIVAGVLGKDGTWVVVLAPALLEAGTHLSERSARFDETPTEGWVLAGQPEEVERARMTRVFDSVTAIPIVIER
jgi:hypothetical protein